MISNNDMTKNNKGNNMTSNKDNNIRNMTKNNKGNNIINNNDMPKKNHSIQSVPNNGNKCNVRTEQYNNGINVMSRVKKFPAICQIMRTIITIM